LPKAYVTVQQKNEFFLQTFGGLHRAVTEVMTHGTERIADHDCGQLRLNIRALFDAHYAETSNKTFALFSESFYKDLKEMILEESGKNLSNFQNQDILVVMIKAMIQDQ